MNDCAIGRTIRIPRETVMTWRRERGLEKAGGRNGNRAGECPRCTGRPLDGAAYTYLLGMYLGDGHIAHMKRGVYSLRVCCDLKYPNIIEECRDAMRTVRSKPGFEASNAYLTGCLNVCGYWKHWPCVFPQHGPGLKHSRDVSLHGWQEEIVNEHPRQLLRGLIHSDGCRDLNRVKGKEYPRYSFINYSVDLQELFKTTCEVVGVRWTQPYWNKVAISRRSDVEFLDTFIGPKT